MLGYLGYLGYLGLFVQPNLFLQNRAKQLSPFGEFSNNNLFLMDFKLHTYGLKYYWNLEFKKNIQDSQNHGFDNPRFMAYQIRKCQVEYCRIRPSRIGHSQTEKGCLITGKAVRNQGKDVRKHLSKKSKFTIGFGIGGKTQSQISLCATDVDSNNWKIILKQEKDNQKQCHL